MPSLYFLHIPKTAGTSFRLWLSRYFHAEKMLMIDHLAELEATSDATLRKHDFYSGHFGWRMMERAAAAKIDCQAVTILREPTATILSGLSFLKQITEDDIMRSGGDLNRLKSMQEISLQIESTSDNVLFTEDDSGPASDNMFVRYFAENGQQSLRPGIIDQSKFELAKQRLEDMKFFGLVEDWEGTAILFAYAYGLPLAPFNMEFNRTSQKVDTFDKASFIEKSKTYFSYDYELYEFAQELFAKRLREVKLNLWLSSTASFDDFKTPLLERFLSTDRGIAKLSNASISIADNFVQSGFEHRYAYEGDWIIWASALKSSIYLPLDATKNLEIRFTIEVLLNDKIQNGLRVYVDGIDRDVDMTHIPSSTKENHFRLEITIRVSAGTIQDRQYTPIDFFVPELVPVKEDDFAANIAFALTGSIIVSQGENVAKQV
jgi:hypothetical protein